jgi:oligopeptide transport system substrate-binding protein
MSITSRRRNLHHLAFILAIFFSIVACKLSSPPAATEAVQPAPTDLPLSTAEPTSTPRPTPTSTPEPTPTPRGFYYNGPGGFSLIIPPAWDLKEEASTYVVLGDDYTTFYMESLAASQPASLDDFIDEWAPTLFEGLSYDKSEPFEMTIGKNLQAQAVDLTTQVADGTTFVVRMIYLHTNNRSYRTFIIADKATMEDSSDRFDDVLGSMDFFAPSFYGLDKSETYTELGWDPLDAEDLDPAMTTSGAGGYPGLLFSGLVRLSPDLQVVPDLAEDLSISSDGKVYTFTLRDGIQFADGRPVTAQDFKDSWERALDPATDSSVALTYLGDILGAREKNAGSADEIAGVKVIDDRTLEITLDGPKPYFLAKLTYPTSYVVDGSQTAGNEWYYEANASGPYKIKEYKPDDYIIFERNDAYWNPPAIPNVLYLFNPGGSPLSMYEEGTLDLVPIWGDDVIRIREEGDPLHAEWQSTTSMCTSMLLFNNTTAPFDDIKVREAFAMSVDKDALVERLANNVDIPAHSILPPAMPGYQESTQSPGYDKVAAKAALAASKYGTNLPEVKLTVGGYGDSESDLVNALVSMWKDVLGVQVTVEYLDPTRLHEVARERANPMTLYGWCADYPDPENFLDILFHSDSDINASAYSNPQVDQLLEQARVEQDSAKRIALYQQIETMLLEDVAAVPYMHGVDNVLVKPRVEGFKLLPMSGSYIPFLSLKDE